MPTVRSLVAGLALAMTAISCSDKTPTDVTTAPDLRAPTAPVVQSAALLTDVPASGPLYTDLTLQTPTGDNISGTFTIKHIEYNKDTKKLEVDGVFKYIDPTTNEPEEQVFENIPATLKKIGGPTQPTCQILELDIGAIHLDVLGLVVDLAPVHLDIVAESGPGNLLGNLLCALTNLLNGPQLGGFLAALTTLLNQINAILGAL